MTEGSRPRGPGPRVQRTGAPQGASPGPRPAGGTPAARAAQEAGSSPLSRASEPRVSPRRDPRRPVPSQPGPRLLPRGEGPPRALQPSPTEAQVALVPPSPSSPTLPPPETPCFWPPRVHQAGRRDPGSPGEPPSLSPGLSRPPATRAPQLSSPPGPSGRPEGPRRPGVSLPRSRPVSASRRGRQLLPPLRPRLLCPVCKVQLKFRVPRPSPAPQVQPRPPCPLLARPLCPPGPSPPLCVHPRPVQGGL